MSVWIKGQEAGRKTIAITYYSILGSGDACIKGASDTPV